MTLAASASANAIRPDSRLLRKYSVPGPRYTSYPTAVQFDESVDADFVEERLAEERGSQRPLSLYFHLPFCEKLCWYCACHKIITRDQTAADRYLDRLQAEMELKDAWFDDRPVVQVHLGGGTPTFFTPEQIERLGELIDTHFDLSDSAECGVEVDPRTYSDEHADALAEAGFNRASLGIQDSRHEVQEAIHRIQPHHLNVEAMEGLRERGFGSINVDLIYGLPYQTPETFQETLDDVVALEPDRFAVYSYAHVPWISPSQKLLETDALPGPDVKIELLAATIESLTSAGYEYIGMDHFARPDDSLSRALADGTLRRNFQGYSTWGGVDIAGFGISAISQSRTMYYQNEKELDAYQEALDEGRVPVMRGVALDEDDQIRRRAIMDVMCGTRIDYEEFAEQTGVWFPDYFSGELERLDELEADELVERREDALVITPLGRLFIRNVAMCFDDYLAEANDGEVRYSKTV